MSRTLFAGILFSGWMLTGCANDGPKPENNGGKTGIEVPRTITYSVINTYPHDTSFYTQGLEFYKGQLFEGTGSGSYAGSFLMEIDVKTGKAIRRLALDKQYFGEGITFLNDTVYQLTYQNNKVFMYQVKDFKKIGEFTIGHEGWGLTNNGKELIASDGSSRLYYYEPGTFRHLRTQSISDGAKLSYNINELEYVNGFIYANQYQTSYLFKIDPEAGRIVGKADLSDLWRRAINLNPGVDVPNGIAYDSSRQSFFLTGKLWPEMYEVKFGEN